MAPRRRKRGGGASPSATAASASNDSKDAPSPVPTSPLRDDDTVGFALLSLLTLATYLPVLSAGFVWDDVIWTEAPAILSSWSGLRDIWLNPFDGALGLEVHYWPVTYTTFWAEHKLWGMEGEGGRDSAGYYHGTNLALHAWNACLVRRVLRRVGAEDGAAWLAAAMFAVHPGRVESVAWAIERKDVLSGLFYLLSLWCNPSIRSEGVASAEEGAAKRGGGGKKRYDVNVALKMSLLFYALAMLSKTIVVSLPVVLLLVPWALRGRPSPEEIRRSVPFFLVGVLMALYDVSCARAGEPVDFGFALAERVLIASRAACHYLLKLIAPAGLCVVYPRWELTEERHIWIGCLALMAVLGAASLYALLRHSGRNGNIALRLPAAALVYFLATLFPVLCFLDYGYMRYAYVADRFAYLASLGPKALFAIGFVRAFGGNCTKGQPLSALSSSSPAGRTIALALLAALATLSRRQSSIYDNEEAYYSHILDLNPNAGMWTNLGNVHMRKGGPRDDLAIECYEKSYAQNRHASKLHTNYAIVLRRSGRAEEAAEVLRVGLEAQEANRAPRKERKTALNELGNVVSDLGRYDEAVSYFRKTLEIDPNYVRGWGNMANDLFRGGKTPEAIEAYGRALDLDPGYGKARQNLAVALSASGRHQESAEQYRELLRRDPGNELFEGRLRGEVAKLGSFP